MKRIALAAAVVIALTGTWTTATAQTPSTDQSSRTPKPPPTCLLPSFRDFSAKVWRVGHWERGAPPASTIAAAHKRIGCAPPGHRSAEKATWARDRKAYFVHRAYKRRWGNCTDAGPLTDCIHGAAVTYGADESWMLAVSLCESGRTRYAHNPSGAESWFQFLPSTWATTPYGSRDITSAKWQSLAAAWMYVEGRSGEWVCSG